MPGGAMEPDDWFYLPTLIMMDRTFVAAAEHDEAVNDTTELVSFLDGALDRHAWLILTYRAIGVDGWGRYPLESFATDLDAIALRDFWVASMNDITLYSRERKAATIDSTWHGGDAPSLEIRVEDGLQNDVFLAPLTVSFALPAPWRGATLAVERNGQPVGSLRTHHQQARAVVDVLPDGSCYRVTGPAAK